MFIPIFVLLLKGQLLKDHANKLYSSYRHPHTNIYDSIFFFRFYYKIHKQIEDFNSRIKQYYNTITISKNIEKKYIYIKVCLYVHEY